MRSADVEVVVLEAYGGVDVGLVRVLGGHKRGAWAGLKRSREPPAAPI